MFRTTIEYFRTRRAAAIARYQLDAVRARAAQVQAARDLVDAEAELQRSRSGFHRVERVDLDDIYPPVIDVTPVVVCVSDPIKPAKD